MRNAYRSSAAAPADHAGETVEEDGRAREGAGEMKGAHQRKKAARKRGQRGKYE